jgi:hypothetical protein
VEESETMDLKKLLNSNQFTLFDFYSYIENCGGVEKLKKQDLEKILKRFGYGLICQEFFFSIYKMVSDNDSGKVINRWTWVVGIATLISTIFTILSYVKPH